VKPGLTLTLNVSPTPQSELKELGRSLEAQLQRALDETAATAAIAAATSVSSGGVGSTGYEGDAQAGYTAHLVRLRVEVRRTLVRASRALSEKLFTDAHGAPVAPSAISTQGRFRGNAQGGARGDMQVSPHEGSLIQTSSTRARSLPRVGLELGWDKEGERMSAVVWLRCRTCELHHNSHVFVYDVEGAARSAASGEVPQLWCSCSAKADAPLPPPRPNPGAPISTKSLLRPASAASSSFRALARPPSLSMLPSPIHPAGPATVSKLRCREL